jgi:hypothetical protein
VRILDPPEVGELLAYSSCQHGDWPAAARREPRGQALERLTGHLGATFPDTLGLRRDGHEGDPSFARIEREYSTGAFLAGQVEVLGMRAEGIRLIASFRQRNRLSGAHHEEAIAKLQGRGDSRATLFEEAHSRISQIIHGRTRDERSTEAA